METACGIGGHKAPMTHHSRLMLDCDGEVVACGVCHADTGTAALTAGRAWLGKYPVLCSNRH